MNIFPPFPRRAPRAAVHFFLLTLLAIAAGAAGPYDSPQAWDQTLAKAKVRAKASFAFPEVNPALPNVLLIGDSISIGYTTGVRLALAGKANVYRIPENGGDTGRGLQRLDAWLGGKKWAVIHFNFGLHDLKYRDPQGRYNVKNGKVVNPPARYEKNLRQLAQRLKASGARPIFATTTPVPDGSAGRIQGDEVPYNTLAIKIMKAHGVAVNDLCALAKAHQARWQLPHNVHFNEEGSAGLATQVAARIARALPPASK